MPFYPVTAFIPQQRSDLQKFQVSKLGYTWISPREMGIPFQLAMAGSTGATAFRAVGALPGGTSVTLSTGLLDQVCYEGDDLFVTYDGADFGAPVLPEGVYYFEVVFDNDITLRSDYFHACTTRANNCIVLTWADTKEWVGGAYYGDGYVNKMWIESNFARPRVEYNEETIDDGFGVLLPVYQRTEEIYTFDVLAVDSQLQVLTSIAQHNTITITSPLGGSAYSINTVRASDTGERNAALAVVEMSFKVDLVENTTIDEPTFLLGTC